MHSDSDTSSDDQKPARMKRKLDDTSEISASLPEQGASEVLSHARLRKLKKKSLKGEPTSNENLTKPLVEEVTDSKTPPKRQNSVWVGNLSFRTTPDQLRDFFKEVGVVTRINMPSGAVNGNSRGFAYVDFETSEAQKMAISWSEMNLDGRRLLIKDGGDFQGRPSIPNDAAGGTLPNSDNRPTALSKSSQKILRSQKHPACPVLFVGNLGFETTIDSIRSMIDSHQGKQPNKSDKDIDGTTDGSKTAMTGAISGLKKVRMGTFEDTGNCKGWAFLDFITTQHATTALLNPRNHHLDGRALVVQYATPDAVRRGGYRINEAKSQHETSTKDLEHHPREKRERPTASSSETLTTSSTDAAEGASKRVKYEDGAEEMPKKRGSTGGRIKQTVQSRPKPGAALAQAQREKTSIVASQGKKIVF